MLQNRDNYVGYIKLTIRLSMGNLHWLGSNFILFYFLIVTIAFKSMHLLMMDAFTIRPRHQLVFDVGGI